MKEIVSGIKLLFDRVKWFFGRVKWIYELFLLQSSKGFIAGAQFGSVSFKIVSDAL